MQTYNFDERGGKKIQFGDYKMNERVMRPVCS